jgi:hypothetical protein
MKLKKIFFVVTAVLLFFFAFNLAAAGSHQKKRFFLLAGMNLFNASGSDSDYKAGENDFPRFPGYPSPVAGLGLAFFTSPRSAWGIDIRYGPSARVDLSDPSDHETIRVDAPQNLTAVAYLQRCFGLSGSLTVSVSAGGGVEYRLAEEKEFISNLGNRIIIGAPKQPLAPLLAAAVGLQFMFSGALGFGLECRAAYAFRQPGQLIVTPALLLVLKL